MGTWIYPPELLEALGPLGFAPSSRTPPELVRSAVDELYKYELRRLRNRLRAGVVARADYLELVIALRRKYWMLTLSLPAWEKIVGGQSPFPQI